MRESRKGTAFYSCVGIGLVCGSGGSACGTTRADKESVTFCCAAPLLPLAFLISKIISVDFQNKGNPLTNLGILFSVNQILYLLIAMWIYPVVPEKMLMVITIIFGAHLMPYSWLYRSKAYMVFSVIIPISALIAGLSFAPYALAAVMIVFEIVFSILLIIENKRQGWVRRGDVK